MNSNQIMAVALVLVFGLIQSISFACDGKGCCKRDGKDMPLEKKFFKKVRMIFHHQDELGISDDQLAKIKELKVALKKDLIQKEADIDLVKVDIRSALYEDEVNLEAVNKLIDQKYETKKSKSKQVVSIIAQLKEILTKDQMDKLKNLKKKQHRGMPEGSHGRHRNR